MTITHGKSSVFGHVLHGAELDSGRILKMAEGSEIPTQKEKGQDMSRGIRTMVEPLTIMIMYCDRDWTVIETVTILTQLITSYDNELW